ncbi:MAG: Ku protein, partial [Rhizobiaceae bacterium]
PERTAANANAGTGRKRAARGAVGKSAASKTASQLKAS